MSIPLFHRSADPGPVAVAGPHGMRLHVDVFPLLARTRQLRKLCNDFLNVPDAYVEFEPSLERRGRSPVAFLAARYTHMDSANDDIGIWKQSEVAFVVPVRETGKGEEGRNFLLAPYIFVDSPASIGTGRENYGWPKLRGYFRGDVHSGLLETAADVVTRKGKGQVFAKRPLLRLSHDPCFNLDSKRAFSGTWSEFVGELEKRDEGDFGDASGLVVGQALALFKSLTVDFVNLRQFRDESSRGNVVYQSIVSSPLTIEASEDFAVLFDWDCSWYQLEVYRRESLPIVQHMGLLTSSSYTTGGGVHVDRLVPLVPFHATLSMRYGTPDRICWRGIRTTNAWQH